MDYRNLITILNIFKGRPYHLSQFLIENNALSKDFLDRICKNKKISNIDLLKMSEDNQYFNNISEMKSYYNSLVEDLNILKNKNSQKDLEIEINKMLDQSILSENYEESSRLRDYMIKNKIKRIK